METSNALKDKSFAIYIYDGVKISIDTEPKKFQETTKLKLHGRYEEAKENMSNSIINDIN